jgi:hypothetical protein
MDVDAGTKQLYLFKANEPGVGLARWRLRVSGLCKLSGSVSAYGGSASADAGKSIEINYQVLVRGGTEYIKFENLTCSDLMGSLVKAAREQLEKALDAYLILDDAVEKVPGTLSHEEKLYAVLCDPKNYKQQNAFYSEWLKAVDDFKQYHGDGVVVEVIWGGVGVVTMTLTSSSNESTMKYGAAGEFSYEGTGGSATVGFTYDGGQSHGKAAVTVHCTSSSSGSCVVEQTNKWFETVQGKLFAELADVKVLERAPDLTAKAAIKDPPKFEKPKEDKSLADKITKIKDIKGLRAYAAASAYDKIKKDPKNKDYTLQQFMMHEPPPAEQRPLATIISDTEKGMSATVKKTDGGHDPFRSDQDLVRVNTDPGTTAPSPSPFLGYTPIGVRVANWDHLFPWLATGYLNSISDTSQVQPMLIYRAMLQDFQALSNLYFIADNCKLNLGYSFIQIANEFAGAAKSLQDGITKDKLGNTGAYTEATNTALTKLSAQPKTIYETWCKNGFLRHANLGFGVIWRYGDKDLSSSMKPLALPPGATMSPGSLPDVCIFDPSIGNYSAFATFYKVLPLILPNGKILAFTPPHGALAWIFVDSKPVLTGPWFSFSLDWGAEFVPDKTAKFLQASDTRFGPVSLYPIPFSAAQGVTWKGSSFSTDLASLSDLNAALTKLKDYLKDRNAWSFSSDGWAKDWALSDSYNDKAIPKQYLGLLEEEAAGS